MDIHVDIRGFLEIHAWIWYGFTDQGVYTLWKAERRGGRSFCCAANESNFIGSERSFFFLNIITSSKTDNTKRFDTILLKKKIIVRGKYLYYTRIPCKILVSVIINIV